MTDYNYLKSILSSYNQDTLWGFTSEGLSIKSIKSPEKYPDYNHGFSGNNKSSAYLNSKFIELPSPITSDFTYFSSVSYNGKLDYTKVEDSEFEVNRKSNIKYNMTPLFQITIPYGEIPPYELGDKVSGYIVYSRKVTFTMSIKVELIYALFSKSH